MHQGEEAHSSPCKFPEPLGSVTTLGSWGMRDKKHDCSLVDSDLVRELSFTASE